MRLQVNNDDEMIIWNDCALCTHLGTAASIVAQIRMESCGFCKCLPCRFVQPAIVGADTEAALEIAQEGISICGNKSRNPKSFV